MTSHARQRYLITQRLRGTLLVGSAHTTGAAIVRALGAVQAQDYRGARWALGQRAGGTTDASIGREFDTGLILRTHVLRPTWHLVVPADIRWMQALTGPRVARAMRPYTVRLELDARLSARSHATIIRALEGGRALTRQELRIALERARLGPMSGQRLAHVMMQAELDALVCSGPMRGAQFTYMLLDERVPPGARRERDDALRELTVRYFATRGPATPQDCAWWSGLAMGDVRRGLELAGRSLEAVDIDGTRYWMAADRAEATVSRTTAHLLPNYDEFFIGYRDRSAIGRRLRKVDIITGGNALLRHVAIADGELVGEWTWVATPSNVRIVMRTLVRITPAERRRFEGCAHRLGVFLGSPADVRW